MPVSGEHLVICDVCGFQFPYNETRKRWDGARVCKKDWEPRHPQDFVRGRKDKQPVPDPRPDPQTVFGQTTVKTGGTKGDSTIDVDSISGIADGDSVGIMLDDETLQWTVANGTPAGDTVTLLEQLAGDTAAGNIVYTPGDDFVATNEVTQGSL